MCGIVGVLNLGHLKIDRIEFEKSLKLISYRGPDASGIYEDEKIILGHNRLAIIDLMENANQPMKLECQKSSNNLIIVFNGEIYNYKNLQKELKNLGHQFNSNSDTEVILHSFEEWGNDCFKKLRGMFAIVIWDKNNKEMILARDRFGIKPLYYFQNDNFFIVASEIKAILNIKDNSNSIKHFAINMFLRQGWISQPQTFYKNIFALEAGMILRISKNNKKKDCFADIQNDFLQEKEKSSFNDAVKKTKSSLLDSVSAHLVSDVEVGAFLSGGIDSSALVALMRELNQEKITTVSAIFPGTNYDESEKIKLISEKFKTNHLNLEISGKDFVENIDDIFSHMDEPTIDGVNTYFVSMAAKEAGLKVVLSGLGGDELFYGYPSFVDIPKIIKFNAILDNQVTEKFLRVLSTKNPFNQKIAKIREMLSNHEYTNQTQIYELLKIYLIYRGLFTGEQIETILNAEFYELIFGHQMSDGHLMSEFVKTNNSSDICNQISVNSQDLISYLELTQYMKNQLLRDSDVFSMAHSIELRVPFVDNILLYEISKIPNEYKFKNGIKKYLLINVLKDLLPKEILNQKKQGFVLTIELWLKNEAKEIVKNELLKSEFYNKNTIELLLNKFYSGKIHWSRIWSLFVLNKFLKNKI